LSAATDEKYRRIRPRRREGSQPTQVAAGTGGPAARGAPNRSGSGAPFPELGIQLSRAAGDGGSGCGDASGPILCYRLEDVTRGVGGGVETRDRRIHYFSDTARLARRRAALAGLPASAVALHRFPDGESLVRLRWAGERESVVVRSLDDPNAKLVTSAPHPQAGAGRARFGAIDLDGAGGRTVTFSGDLGRPSHPLLRSPAPPPAADIIVVESTYGDRRHDDAGSMQLFEEALRRTAERGGVTVIPRSRSTAPRSSCSICAG
jgi:hypothetical protein